MAKRVDKATADYTDQGSRAEHCSLCTHFLRPDQCEEVEGQISPRAWCKYFTLPAHRHWRLIDAESRNRAAVRHVRGGT